MFLLFRIVRLMLFVSKMLLCPFELFWDYKDTVLLGIHLNLAEEQFVYLPNIFRVIGEKKNFENKHPKSCHCPTRRACCELFDMLYGEIVRL